METIHSQISEIIDYRFTNESILEEALTHPSLQKKNSKNQNENFERLEFLGDSILNMVVSTILFRLFPEEEEGDLAQRKANLCSGRTIVRVAKEINLGDFIFMSDNEQTQGGRNKSTNLEDAFEALIGAVYIDGGIEKAKKLIKRYWNKLAEDMVSRRPPQDFRSRLQIWAQRNRIPIPEYELVSQIGAAHKFNFTIAINIKKYGKVLGSGFTKKIAEQKAAKLMLQRINERKKCKNSTDFEGGTNKTKVLPMHNDNTLSFSPNAIPMATGISTA